MTTYVPPEQRPEQWARDAAQLCVTPDAATELLRTGLLRLAAEQLHEVLGDGTADDWLDARVADFVDQDLLDPDAAVALVTLAVCQGDALVLAEVGQRWTLLPKFAAYKALPDAVTITARDGGQVDLRHDDGDQEHGVDVSLLTGCYRLTHWGLAGQEVT